MARTLNVKSDGEKGGCGCDMHSDICKPEPYRYKYKYNCTAIPCNFKRCDQPQKCPCCPQPYTYSYTVVVTCNPTECVREDTCNN